MIISKYHFAIPVLFVMLLPFLGCNSQNLEVVDYTPISENGWTNSTPLEQGLAPALVSKLYSNAAKVRTIFSLLVVKNGYLVAEHYFHGGSIGQKARIQSVTKSFTSALVGIALEQSCLTSPDQKMMDFFPELTDQIKDQRKNQITIRHLLQMRAGYAWEESTGELFKLLYSGFRPATLLDVPLVRNPGTGFDYSNLSSHLLGIIVARTCGTDLNSFAQDHLFRPLAIEPGEWIQGWEGYYNGHADLHMSARDMAKFGLLYLNEGQHNGEQIVPSEWVHESLKSYTTDAWYYRVGKNFKHVGYGYQWWSVKAGDFRYNLAWGHGGQQIALIDELDMVIVVTADPLFGKHGGGPWKHEKANLNLVANFIASLSKEKRI
ncbi:serine hydrolase [candidate division KSB1 bacterium]|nr:serine hydrolase [candidate division KSB1 bacterium]